MAERTALYNEHLKLGGHVIDFAGWELPVYYTNIIDEHNTVRNAVGLFDICHMGEFYVNGKDTSKLLQKVITRNLEGMKDNGIRYGMMLYENGGIIDDLLFYKFNDEKFFVVVNASNIAKDFEWLKKHAHGMDVKLENVSATTMKLDLQGPKAIDVLSKISDIDLAPMKHYNFTEGMVAGHHCLVSRTGYTGEDGFEIYSAVKNASIIWNAIMEAGKEFGIKPIGLGARDTLRLECAMMLYGNDIDDKHTPLDADLEWVVGFDKDFIGKRKLESQKENGTEQKLVAYEMQDSAIARHGYEIVLDGKPIGIVTSGTYSPTLKRAIGLGYVDSHFAGNGNDLAISVRDSLHRALIVNKPFYKRKK